MIAVLTGDIIGSQKMEPDKLRGLLNKLLNFLEQQKNANYPGLLFEIYRGDSIQIALMQPEHALKLAVLIRTCVIGYTPSSDSENENTQETVQSSETDKIQKAKKTLKYETELYDIRISISIGVTNPLNSTLGTSNGTAFVDSGHGLDAMKKNERFVFNSQDKALNAFMNVGIVAITQIMQTWTLNKTKIMLYVLCGISREKTCIKFGIAQSTLSTTIKNSNFYDMKRVLDCTEQYIKMITEQDK